MPYANWRYESIEDRRQRELQSLQAIGQAGRQALQTDDAVGVQRISQSIQQRAADPNGLAQRQQYREIGERARQSANSSGGNLLSRLGGLLGEIDKPLSERLGLRIPEMRGPIDEIGNFVLEEGTRPSTLAIGAGGAGLAAKAGTVAARGGARGLAARGVQMATEPIAGGGVGRRLLGETALATGGRLGGEAATNLVPEDAPAPLRVGAALAGGLAGGLGGAAGVGSVLRGVDNALLDTARAPDWLAGAQRGAAERALTRRGTPIPTGGAVAPVETVTRNTYVTPMRPLDDVVQHVATKATGGAPAWVDAPGVRKMTEFVNPSVLERTDVGRTLVGYARQQDAIEQLTAQTVMRAVDRHAPSGGRASTFQSHLGQQAPLDVDPTSGIVRNVTPKTDGDSLIFGDVFERRERYNLTTEQERIFDDIDTVVRELNEMRVENGLKSYNTGKRYFPRSVEVIRDVDIRRTNHAAERLYDTMAEGIEAGVEYSTDPRAILEALTRNTYHEVLTEQLSTALTPHSITPKVLLEAVRPQVVTRMQGAIDNLRGVRQEIVAQRKAAIREGSDIRVPGEVRGASPAELEQARRNLQRARRAAQRGSGSAADVQNAERNLQLAQQQYRRRAGATGSVKPLTPELNAKLEAARKEYATAKHAYTKALDGVKSAEIAPGHLFGQGEKEIPIGQWRNRFFPREEVERLQETMASFARPGDQTTGLNRAIEWIGDNVRFFAAAGDFGAPMIQGLPLLARNPVQWGRATAAHYLSFLNPNYLAKYADNHADTFSEMAQYGVPVQDTEMFRAIQSRPGQTPDVLEAGARAVERIPNGEAFANAVREGKRQTYGRFQSAYDGFLAVARAEMWEGMKPKWVADGGDLEQLARHVKNMTGGLSSKGLGVSANRRARESMWLAFSPRLLRSTVALGGEVFSSDPVLRREAVRTLSQFVGGVAGVYVAAGLAMGKSGQEIQEGLNPTSGKKFLSYNINGDWVGVGGQIRALTQLGAQLATDPVLPWGRQGPFESSVLATRLDENTLFQFYRNRGAPALNIVGAVGEAATGADMLPFAEVNSVPDLVKHLGTSALPFAVQGYVEGNGPSALASEFFGARGSAETAGDVRDRLARERHNKPFGELEPYQQAEIRMDPIVRDIEERQRERFPESPASIARRELYAQQEADDLLLISGQLTREEWLGERDRRGVELRARLGQIYGDGEISEAQRQNDPMAKFAWAIQQAEDPTTGRVDWDAVEDLRARDFTAAENDYIDRNSGVSSTPLSRAYSRTMRGYYELPQYIGYSGDEGRVINDTWQIVRNRATEIAASLGREPDQRIMAAAYAELAPLLDADQDILTGVQLRIMGRLRDSTEREQYIREHPEIAVFRGSGPLTLTNQGLAREIVGQPVRAVAR